MLRFDVEVRPLHGRVDEGNFLMYRLDQRMAERMKEVFFKKKLNLKVLFNINI